jgi:hypothetical protein
MAVAAVGGAPLLELQMLLALLLLLPVKLLLLLLAEPLLLLLAELLLLWLLLPLLLLEMLLLSLLLGKDKSWQWRGLSFLPPSLPPVFLSFLPLCISWAFASLCTYTLRVCTELKSACCLRLFQNLSGLVACSNTLLELLQLDQKRKTARR